LNSQSNYEIRTEIYLSIKVKKSTSFTDLSELCLKKLSNLKTCYLRQYLLDSQAKERLFEIMSFRMFHKDLLQADENQNPRRRVKTPSMRKELIISDLEAISLT